MEYSGFVILSGFFAIICILSCQIPLVAVFYPQYQVQNRLVKFDNIVPTVTLYRLEHVPNGNSIDINNLQWDDVSMVNGSYSATKIQKSCSEWMENNKISDCFKWMQPWPVKCPDPTVTNSSVYEWIHISMDMSYDGTIYSRGMFDLKTISAPHQALDRLCKEEQGKFLLDPKKSIIYTTSNAPYFDHSGFLLTIFLGGLLGLGLLNLLLWEIAIAAFVVVILVTIVLFVVVGPFVGLYRMLRKTNSHSEKV